MSFEIVRNFKIFNKNFFKKQFQIRSFVPSLPDTSRPFSNDSLYKFRFRSFFSRVACQTRQFSSSRDFFCSLIVCFSTFVTIFYCRFSRWLSCLVLFILSLKKPMSFSFTAINLNRRKSDQVLELICQSFVWCVFFGFWRRRGEIIIIKHIA